MTRFMLRSQEYVALQALDLRAHRGREWRRAQALLWLHGGESVSDIAERLGVTRQTVYNWADRFRERLDHPLCDRLCDAKRSGRPRTALGVIDPLIDAVIDRPPDDFGYRATTWTAARLGQYLSEVHGIEVCDKSVRLAIARLDVGWKRPRHQLARRPETWRQAKGG